MPRSKNLGVIEMINVRIMWDTGITDQDVGLANGSHTYTNCNMFLISKIWTFKAI